MKFVIIAAIMFYLLTRKPKNGDNGDNGNGPSDDEKLREYIDKSSGIAAIWAALKWAKGKVTWVLKQWSIIAFLVVSWKVILRQMSYDEALALTRQNEDNIFGPSWPKWTFEQKRNIWAQYPSGLYRTFRIRWSSDLNPKYDYHNDGQRIEFRKDLQTLDDRYGQGITVYPSLFGDDVIKWDVGSQYPWKEGEQ